MFEFLSKRCDLEQPHSGFVFKQNGDERLVVADIQVKNAAVKRAAQLAKAAGAKRAIVLPVSAPFHCALMQPAQEEVARVLGGLELNDPKIPVAANVSGTIVTSADGARSALIEQVTGAVMGSPFAPRAYEPLLGSTWKRK